MGLFKEFVVGGKTLSNRIVMAPMTRSRADFQGNVSSLALEYYSQRATAGLLITEAIGISPQAHGYPFTPGIWTKTQVDGWRAVTDAVHARGGLICAQLWHVGRVFASANNPLGLAPVGPAAVAAEGQIFTKGGPVPLPVPRALSTQEVRSTAADYGTAASRAFDAGFDFVELHGANGYLIEQFLSDEANIRADEFGGSANNRLNFLRAVLDEVESAAGGLSQVGVRLSPYGDFNGINHSNHADLFDRVLGLLAARKPGYLHLIEPSVSGDGSRRTAKGDQAPDVLKIAHAAFSGPIIACADYDRARADATLKNGCADLIAFGRPFISNPDLVERMRDGIPAAPWDRSTFYTRGEKGYTDYPTLASAPHHV
ncbi:alkene reductase [Chelatococcus asaccharovorans]|uniref:N-ethylmaleimide reductase n=1 Tax=Chelatococcus asaccharovorans TaxID=28210 RepID=A0A2V3U246_9HYPH|nr:alkene reductase [Chelatococcus asaccharovorans]MBS7707834.1 alkene reductase [Chelatococcus asaccharovorans]PXW50919.1 N-ethylmaleimide reductase [Chelatococcus asaccharovorans]